MSASNRPEDLDEPSKYAPKWVREGQQKPFEGRVRHLPSAPQLAMQDPLEPPDVPNRRGDGSFEGDYGIKRMRMQRSLEPERITEPEWSEPARFPFGMIVRAAAAIGVATVGALIYVGAVPLPFGQAVSVATVQETTGTDQRPVEPRDPPRSNKMPDRVGEMRVPQPTRVQPVSVTPPPAPEQQVARLEEPPPAPGQVKPWPQATPSWSPPQQQAAPAPAPAPVRTQPVVPQQQAAPAPAPAAALPAPVITRQLDPEEIETLIKRGEAFVNQGDITAGRLMLKRAAEAGSSRAALVLGGTFDPEVLRKMGVLGLQADSAQAREWYEKAAALGSNEASRRLAGINQ